MSILKFTGPGEVYIRTLKNGDSEAAVAYLPTLVTIEGGSWSLEESLGYTRLQKVKKQDFGKL